MVIIEGLELQLPDQEKNSAPSTETPLYINGTLKFLFSQGGKNMSAEKREMPHETEPHWDLLNPHSFFRHFVLDGRKHPNQMFGLLVGCTTLGLAGAIHQAAILSSNPRNHGLIDSIVRLIETGRFLP